MKCYKAASVCDSAKDLNLEDPRLVVEMGLSMVMGVPQELDGFC